MLTFHSNSSIGREATRLRSAIFTYINFVAKYGAKETLYTIAPLVVNRLRDFIENQGWPKVGGNEDLVSRGYAYEVIGLLTKAGPKSVLVEEDNPTLDLLRWLFSSLAKDSSGSSIIVSIEDALSSIITSMARFDLTTAEQNVLEDLLIDQMEQSSDLEVNKRLRSTRYVATRYANRCLPYNSVKARWVNVLGLGATKDRAEVREEAQRGLSPYWYQMINGASTGAGVHQLLFPSFEAVIHQFFFNQPRTAGSDLWKLARQAEQSLPAGFGELTAYARRMLYHEAMSRKDVAVGVDDEWERRLDVAVENDPKVREAIKE